MGYSVTWCAVREDDAERFLKKLSLSPTGEAEEIPESLISTARLDTGWRLVWYNSYDCQFLQPHRFPLLSSDLDVLLCRIEEHVMASSAEKWCSGVRTWWVSHEGEDGPVGVSTDGDLPECFTRIRQEMEKAQLAGGGADADVDYLFDIPLLVAQELVGFKHDEGPNVKDGHFQVLSRTAPPEERSPGIFSRLFRKRPSRSRFGARILRIGV